MRADSDPLTRNIARNVDIAFLAVDLLEAAGFGWLPSDGSIMETASNRSNDG